MKKTPKIIGFWSLLLLGLLLYACNKEEAFQGATGIAKVNVVNAIVSGGKVKASVSAKKINWNDIPDNQALGEWSLGKMFIVPTDQSTIMKIVSLADTTKIWFNQNANLKSGKMYSLYLSGTPGNIKTAFHEEMNFPKPIIRDAGRKTPVTDSIVNIRFVNLSPSGPKVDINIQGKNSNEISDLSYEAFTEFKAYPAKKGNDYIIFEIRKSSNKQLIANYALYVPTVRFKSIAIVMMGIYPGLTVPYIDQFRADMVVYQ